MKNTALQLNKKFDKPYAKKIPWHINPDLVMGN